MISAMLCGGLGGRMFQIATAYVLALDNNDTCAFDLNMGSISQDHHPGEYRDNVFKKLKQLPEGWKPKATYQQKGHNYDSIPYQKDLMIGGYFSSERYFNHRREEVIKLFKDLKTIKSIKLNFKNSVSVHVRRGDYLINSSYVCPEEYYKEAIELISKETQIDYIYILSDDMPWCKEIFKGKKYKFLYDPDYVSFYVMTLCENNIMSNSTFSRFATFMNENENKIVYAPKTWFTGYIAEQITDVFLNDWNFI